MNMTKSEEKVYNCIVTYLIENSYAPSVREICESVGLKSTSSVHWHMRKLEIKGFIKVKEKEPRAIQVMGYKFVKEQETPAIPTEDSSLV